MLLRWIRSQIIFLFSTLFTQTCMSQYLESLATPPEYNIKYKG